MKVGAGGTAAVGQHPPLDNSGKLPSERLLQPGTRRKANPHNSAKSDRDLNVDIRQLPFSIKRPNVPFSATRESEFPLALPDVA